MLRRICIALTTLVVSTAQAQEVFRGSAEEFRDRREVAERHDLDALVAVGQSADVSGTIVLGADMGPTIAAPDSSVLLRVANPEALPKFARQLPYQFKVTRQGDSVYVNSAQVAAVTNWNEGKNRFPVDRYAALHQSFNELEAELNKSGQEATMSAANIALANTISKVEAQTILGFQNAPSGASELKEFLCSRFAELRDLRLKARYGRVDNYRPEVYQRIYESSRCDVAIARSGQDQPFGSGVLIGNGIVLTCKHIAEKYPLPTIEVWHNYESTVSTDAAQQRHSYTVKSLLTVGEKLPLTADPLDYALLKIEAASPDSPPVDSLPRAVLSSAECARDDAIYVVGHPAGNPCMIHDNAFVLFPYVASKTGMTELEMIVCNEVQQSPNAENELRQFIDSYVSEDGGASFRQYSKRWAQSPVIAADCDTYHGNSGSAAWDRSTNKVIGILFAGEDDVGPAESHSPGWVRHEAILPISVILGQVDSKLPSGWRVSYGVTVK